MGTPFKMKGFSGFINSPLRQEKHFLEKEKTIPQVDVKTKKTNPYEDLANPLAGKNLGMVENVYEDLTKHSPRRVKKGKIKRK
tara:strand:+ start:69 stop:317 length:249 start_codon:yes stop_codon:yes gene_type:complete